MAEAKALVHHGVVSQAQLSQLKGANGYKNVATDVMVLVNVLQTVLPQIQGRSLTTAEDLERASRVATRLLRIVGLREQGPAQIAEATDLRLRAYTSLILAYDDARRAVTYLRGAKDDADSIAPSLHPGRPRQRKGSEPEVPAAGGTSADSSGGAAATATGSADTTPGTPNAHARGAQPPVATPATSRNDPFLS